MSRRLKVLAWGLLFWLGAVGFALAQSQSPVGPGMWQFSDGNGAPYSGGKVYMYEPFTTTPKATFKDPNGLVQNTNPTILDANGRGIFWGSGLYRQVFQDSLGNVIWDQQTFAPTTAASVSSASAICAATTTTGSANAQILSPTTAVQSLVVGTIYCGIAGFSNSSTMTLQISTLSPQPVKKQSISGPVVLTGSEVVVGQGYLWQWDGLEFQLLNPSTTNTYPVIDVIAYGATGNGSTNDSAALQSAFTAAQGAGGGLVRFPCGTFYVDTGLTLTVASKAHVSIQGSGQDCTILYFHGGINGITETLTDAFSTAEVNDLTLATDQVGSNVALTWTMPGTSIFAYNNVNSSRNLTIRGYDYNSSVSAGKSTGTQYWNYGWSLTNVSNVNSENFLYQGVNFSGKGILYQGNAGSSSYAVVFNSRGATINNCATGVVYGEWVQGMAFNQANIIGCSNGITTGVGSTTTVDVLDQLSISDSSFNTQVCGVCINAEFFNALLMSNDVVITTGGVGVKLQGTGNLLDNVVFGGTTVVGTVGVKVLGAFGNGSIVKGSQFASYGAGVQTIGTTSGRIQLTDNQFSLNTLDYDINAAMTGVAVIEDNQPRNYSTLPTCATRTGGSRMLVVDSNTSTFYNAVAGGGGFVGTAVCDGTSWKFH